MFYFNKKLIFDRFLTGNSYFFLISALSLTLIVWIIQAVNFLDFVTEDGHGLAVYFGYTFLNFQKIFTKLMPIMFFISLFYTINKFNEKNELQIFWLNGINKIEFLNALIKYALIFFSLQIILNSFVVPFSQNKARTFIQNSNIDFFPSLIKEKRFIDTVEKLTIYVEKKNSQNEFTNIYLKDDDTPRNTKIISAKRGKLINLNDDRFFELYNGKIMNIDKDKITIFNFKKTNFDLSKYVTKSTIKFKTQELSTAILIECVYNYFVIKKYYITNQITCNGDSIGIIKQESIKRIIEPLYYFALVGCLGFLLLNFRESFGNKYLKISSFLLGFGVLIVSEVSISLSGKSDFHSYIALISPIIIFIVFYLMLKNKLDYLKLKRK